MVFGVSLALAELGLSSDVSYEDGDMLGGWQEPWEAEPGGDTGFEDRSGCAVPAHVTSALRWAACFQNYKHHVDLPITYPLKTHFPFCTEQWGVSTRTCNCCWTVVPSVTHLLGHLLKSIDH